MRYLLIVLISLTSFVTHAQKEGFSKIIVQTNDTTHLYKRVKTSLINLDFIVKDLESDTLKTYPREFLNDAYLIITAAIKGNEVTLTGIWGSRKLNFFGASSSPKDYKTVVYYKGSIEWKILRLVAEAIGGELSFKE